MLNPLDCDKINEAADMLRYRDHIAVNLSVKREVLFPDQWIYMHSPEVQIVKVANYNNFSKKMVENKNITALGVGYFVSKNQGLWNEPDGFLAQLAINELDKIGLVKKNEIEKSWVVRETETYPVYYLGFQEYYDLLKKRVDQFTNFYSIGRAGMHQHNNMDCSLKSGILAARNYLKLPGSPYILWDTNTDAQYL
jgi:protoporphyrinogen oxidase